MAQFPSSSSASGVWDLKDQYIAASGSNWPSLSVTVDYLVLAGGGAGSNNTYGGGGGGAGGLRSTVTATGGGGTLESAFPVSIRLEPAS